MLARCGAVIRIEMMDCATGAVFEGELPDVSAVDRGQLHFVLLLPMLPAVLPTAAVRALCCTLDMRHVFKLNSHSLSPRVTHTT